MSAAAFAADDAAQAVRAFNHATIHPDSLTGPADIYGILGSLYTLTQRLPQAFEQLAKHLERQHSTGRLTFSDWRGEQRDVEEAVAATVGGLRAASELLESATSALQRAQNDLSNVGIAVAG